MSSRERPLPVRVLRFGGWFTLLLAGIAFAVGGMNRFDGLAGIWGVIGGELLLTAVFAFWGSRPTPDGFLAALFACALLLLIFPLVIAVALVTSQSWPQVREYYGLTRRAA